MNEDEKRREILKAEAAIRELAARMAQASEYARQADMAKCTLEAAARSIDELCNESRSLMESYREVVRAENKSINRALESFESCVKDLQKVCDGLENKAEDFETSVVEKNQEFYEIMDSKLDNQSQTINEIKDQLMIKAEHLDISIDKQSQTIHELIDAKASNLSKEINKAQDHLSEKANHLEASIDVRRQESFRLLDAKLDGLSQDFGTLSDRLEFVIEQNDVLDREIRALKPIIEEWSSRFRGFGNAMDCNSKENVPGTQIMDTTESLYSARYGAGSKTPGLIHRLRSAIK
jgi:DNA repair exonuclease SbcCD ATPase subunit